MSEHGPAWDRDEAFRQSVIRKAMLLGFSAFEYPSHPYDRSARSYNMDEEVAKWAFFLDGKEYNAYSSLYSAAFDFLRLQKLEYLAGEYRG